MITLVAGAAARVAASNVVDDVYELLLPCRDQIVATPTACLGSVAHHVGMLATRLGRLRDADDAFAQATETHERMNAPIWSARTRLEWGRSLITREPERGLVQLTLAEKAARAWGPGTSSWKPPHSQARERTSLGTRIVDASMFVSRDSDMSSGA